MSEEEYYASLLSNPDYAKPKFSIYRFKNILIGKHRSDDTKLNLSKVHKQLWENEEFRNTHLSIVRNNLSASWEKTQKKIYQYDTNGDFVAVWNKCKDAADFLYGAGKGGSLTRNIKLNNKRGKLGFSKKGYIWSFFAPQRKEGI